MAKVRHDDRAGGAPASDPALRRIRARLVRLIGAAPLAWAAMMPEAAKAETLSLSAFSDIARRCGSSVAVSTLAAIAKTESGFRTLVVADNRTRRSQVFQSIEAATAVAENLIARGHSIDLGLMQINSANLKRLGYSARDALDSCKSVSGGALILTRNYQRSRNPSNPQSALRDALSRYNTGNPRDGYRNGYVRRVELAARSLLPGFATAASRAAPTSPAGPVRLARPVIERASSTRWWDVWGSLERSVAPAAGAMKSENVLIF